MSRRAAAGLAAVGLLVAAAGCEPPCPKELVTLETLIREHNANADAVPRLWARAKLAVTLVHPDGWRFTWGSTADQAVPNGLLLLAKGADRLGPHDFVLIGRETLAMELFRLGSSTEEGKYYFWYRFGQRGGAWFGRHEFAGAPGIRHMPIDPTQLLSVLAVCALPADTTKLPAVALSMQRDPRDYAYVVTYLDRQPVTGQILFRREVHFRWSDTEPRRAYKVNLFDAAGRRVVTARMGDYRPVDVSDLDDPPAVAPVLPTDIEIVCNPFPGVQVFVERIHLVLSEMTAADVWERGACRLSSALPPGLRAVQVDAHLEPAPARRDPEGGGP